jgi:hypothetical protein
VPTPILQLNGAANARRVYALLDALVQHVDKRFLLSLISNHHLPSDPSTSNKALSILLIVSSFSLSHEHSNEFVCLMRFDRAKYLQIMPLGAGESSFTVP